MNVPAHIVTAALAVALVALAGGFAVCLHCQRMKKRYVRSIVNHIREQERVERELERALIEKTTLENALLKRLSGAAGTPGAQKNKPTKPKTK